MSGSETTGGDDLDAARLDDLFQGWAADRDLSGAVLATRGGRTLFEGCYGLADRAAGLPVTPRTRFGLASVTKLFTAVAVADAVGRDLLAFEAAVVDVLPPHRRPSTLRPDVTVHHLLCHTSGLADYCEEDEDSPAYLQDYGSLWETVPSSSVQRPADFLPLFGDLPPYGPPGERTRYCNAGYVVLGLVLEEVHRGRPYTEVVQERVLDRAGMSASGFFRLDEARPDVAVGYLTAEPGRPRRSNVFRIPVVGGPDGGAFSTCADLDAFLHRVDDGSLLGPLTSTLMARHADAGSGFAFGYGVLHYPDGRWGHGGGDPGVEVLVQRWPRTDTSLVVLCNTEGPAGDVRDAVVAEL